MSSLPLAPFYQLALAPSYSGDLATSRYSNVASDGTRVTVDIIQSIPKKGRWRHVARCVYTRLDAVTKQPVSTTVTVTFDHPEFEAKVAVLEILNGFLAVLAPAWDEIVIGQQ